MGDLLLEYFKMDKFTKDFLDGLDEAEKELKKKAEVRQVKAKNVTVPVKVRETGVETRQTEVSRRTVGVTTTTPKVTRVQAQISETTVRNNTQERDDEE